MVGHQRARGVHFSWHTFAASTGGGGGGVSGTSGSSAVPPTSASTGCSEGVSEVPDFLARLSQPTRVRTAVPDGYSGLRVCDICHDMYHAEMRLQAAGRVVGRQLGVRNTVALN
jgi:hypothetical protein